MGRPWLGPADGDVYFESLAALHKAHLKYERIVEIQAVPTPDQIGPRGLLQYGSMNLQGVRACPAVVVL